MALKARNATHNDATVDDAGTNNNGTPIDNTTVINTSPEASSGTTSKAKATATTEAVKPAGEASAINVNAKTRIHTRTDEDSSIGAEDDDPMVQRYFQHLNVTRSYLQTRIEHSNFQPTDSRSLEFLFCAPLLLKLQIPSTLPISLVTASSVAAELSTTAVLLSLIIAPAATIDDAAVINVHTEANAKQGLFDHTLQAASEAVFEGCQSGNHPIFANGWVDFPEKANADPKSLDPSVKIDVKKDVLQ
ncbi:hypothetical protein Hte_001562 [Hypoxylon texense]